MELLKGANDRKIFKMHNVWIVSRIENLVKLLKMSKNPTKSCKLWMGALLLFELFARELGWRFTALHMEHDCTTYPPSPRARTCKSCPFQSDSFVSRMPLGTQTFGLVVLGWQSRFGSSIALINRPRGPLLGSYTKLKKIREGNRFGLWRGLILTDNSRNGKKRKFRSTILIHNVLTNLNFHFLKNRKLISCMISWTCGNSKGPLISR